MKNECMVSIEGQAGPVLLKSYLNTICTDSPRHEFVIGDALYGGHTQPFVYYFKSTNNATKIFYLDFTSLYPWVHKTQQFAVGLQKKITGNDIPKIPKYTDEMETTYFGVDYVHVIPPRELYIPVLLKRYNEKLVYTLCHTCAEKVVEGECEHTREQRIIKGVYTTTELKLAIDKGYTIIDILEV